MKDKVYNAVIGGQSDNNIKFADFHSNRRAYREFSRLCEQ